VDGPTKLDRLTALHCTVASWTATSGVCICAPRFKRSTRIAVEATRAAGEASRALDANRSAVGSSVGGATGFPDLQAVVTDAAWTLSAGPDEAQLDALQGNEVPEDVVAQRWAMDQVVQATMSDQAIADVFSTVAFMALTRPSSPSPHHSNRPSRRTRRLHPAGGATPPRSAGSAFWAIQKLRRPVFLRRRRTRPCECALTLSRLEIADTSKNRHCDIPRIVALTANSSRNIDCGQ